MANYVRSDIRLTGNCKGFIEKYGEILREEKGFFQAITPMNQKLLEDDTWFSWRLFHWGTRGEPFNTCFESSDEHSATFCFDTPWSHPFPIFRTLADEFPEIHFDIVYCDEELYTTNNGWYEIFRAEELDDSGNPAELHENDQFYKEILSRTWGEDEEEIDDE